MADVITTNPGISDPQDIWQQAFDATIAALPGVPIQAAKEIASTIAANTRKYYLSAVSQGKAPGVALQEAEQWRAGWIADAQKKNNVKPPVTTANPLTDPNGANAAIGATEVQSKDVTDAVNTFRNTTKGALDKYTNPDKVTPPTPQSLIKPVTAATVNPLYIADAAPVKATQVTAPPPVTAAQATAAGAIQTTDARAAGAINPALMTPAARLAAAEQRGTTVAGTGLDTTQADQSRGLVAASLADLQATSQGQGAGQLAAALRAKLDAAKIGQTVAGAARTARGSERKGALIGGQLAAAEQGSNALIAREEQAARERQAASAAYTTAAQATRSTDVDVAAKKADLQKSRNELQASLDAARAAGDANRVQEITVKIAELDQQVKALNTTATNAANEAAAGRTTAVELANVGAKNLAAEGGATRATTVSTTNAGQANTVADANAARTLAAGTTNATLGTDVAKTNVDNRIEIARANADHALTASTGNADRGVTVATTNNAQALAAQKQQEDQRIAQEDLKIKLQEAAQQAAQGLLNEAQREELIKQARAGIALSQAQLAELVRSHAAAEATAAKQQEVNGWLALLQTATSLGTAVIAKSDVRLKEDIKKVSPADLDALAAAVAKSVATFRYKPGNGLPEGPRSGVMAQDIEGTKLGKTVVRDDADGTKSVDYGTLATLLAARSLKARKGIN